MTRRIFYLLLAGICLLCLLSACDGREEEPSTTSPSPSTTEEPTGELMSGEHFAMERVTGWERGSSENKVQQTGSTAQMDVIVLGSYEPDPAAYLQKFHDTYRDSGLGKNLTEVDTVSIGGIGAAWFQFEDTVSQEGTVKAIYCLNQNEKTYLVTCWAIGQEDFDAADFPALIEQIQFD